MKKKFLSAILAAAMVLPTLVLPVSAEGETVTVTYEPENYVIHYSNQYSPTGRPLISVNQMGTKADGTTVGTSTANDIYYLEYTIKKPEMANKVTVKMPGVKLKSAAASTEFDFTVKANMWFSTEERQSPVTGIYEEGTDAYTTWRAYCRSGYVDRGDGNGNVQVISKILGSGLAPSSFTNPVATSSAVNFDVEMDITNVDNAETNKKLLEDLVARQEDGEAHLDFLFTANGASGTNRQDSPAWATATTIEVEYDRDAIVAYINGAADAADMKARLNESAELLDIDMSTYETVDDEFGAYLGNVDTYDKLMVMLEDLIPQSIKDQMPVYKPVDLSAEYNVSGLYTVNESVSGGGNAHGNGGYICAKGFKAISGWKEEWIDGKTENILKANDVDFRIKVDSANKAKTAISAVTLALDEGSIWRTIDMDDMKYSSVDMLCNGALSEAWTSTTVKLNYTDGSSTLWDCPKVANLAIDLKDAAKAETYGVYGYVQTKIHIGSDWVEKDGYIAHYRIPTNSELVLDNIQLLSGDYNWDFEKNEAVLTENKTTPGTLSAFEKANNIYAITGVTTIAEENARLEAEKEKAPVSMPVDLSAKYNVTGLFKTAGSTGGNAHGSNGYIGADAFKAQNIWKNEWTEGMTENTLTANGIEFDMRVDTANNAKVAVVPFTESLDDGNWMTIDMANMKYTSVDFLGYFALSTMKWGTTSFKLNYTNGTSQYKEFKEIAIIGNDPTSDPKYEVYGKLDVKVHIGSTYAESNGYISHYRIPTDPELELDNIQILAWNYDLTANGDGTYTEGSMGEATINKDVNIHAITGVTTKAVWREQIAAAIEARITALMKTGYDADEIAAIEEEIAEAVAQGIDVSTISNYEEFLTYKTDGAPFYKPVALEYNVNNLYSDDPDFAGGQAHGSNGFIYAQQFKDRDIWKKAWTEGMTENILTSEGVEFNVKVDPTKGAMTGLSAITAAMDPGTNWMTIDMTNMKYTSVDLLMHYALSSRDYGTTSIMLNYKDGTSELKEFMDIATLDKNPASDAKYEAFAAIPVATRIGSRVHANDETTDDHKKCLTDKDGYLSHYRIPADGTKVLDNIQVLAWNYDLVDNGDGTYTETNIYNKSSVARATVIHAVTGVTTVGEENARPEVELPENTLSFTPSVRTEGDKVYADLKVINTTNSSADYVLILAAYDTNNKLLAVKASAQKKIAKNAGEDSFSIDMDTQSTATQYKAMVWDSIVGMKPYGQATN